MQSVTVHFVSWPNKNSQDTYTHTEHYDNYHLTPHTLIKQNVRLE